PTLHPLDVRQGSAPTDAALESPVGAPSRNEAVAHGGAPRPPGAPGAPPQIASSPRSPVRTRTSSSSGPTQIFPSPRSDGRSDVCSSDLPTLHTLDVRQGSAPTDAALESPVGAPSRNEAVAHGGAPRPPGAPGAPPQIASSPRSPVRIRTASSIGPTKIFPSP